MPFLLSLSIAVFYILGIFGSRAPEPKKEVTLFDGKSFRGWEGDTIKTWRIEQGALVGGSLTEKVPHNEFLCTTRDYSDFILKLEFKLEGSEGFINSGVQFRSVRAKNPVYEMIGYQADIGPGYWAGIYDETRRNVTLVKPDSATLFKHLKSRDWNDFEVRAKGRNMKVFLNGIQMVDYTEKDISIPQNGLIGLQIHGGGKALVRFRAIRIREL